jgi:hypothetical protein
VLAVLIGSLPDCTLASEFYAYFPFLAHPSFSLCPRPGLGGGRSAQEGNFLGNLDSLFGSLPDCAPSHAQIINFSFLNLVLPHVPLAMLGICLRLVFLACGNAAVPEGTILWTPCFVSVRVTFILPVRYLLRLVCCGSAGRRFLRGTPVRCAGGGGMLTFLPPSAGGCGCTFERGHRFVPQRHDVLEQSEIVRDGGAGVACVCVLSCCLLCSVPSA